MSARHDAMEMVVGMSLAECEAMVLFIAERAELWTRHALDCGVVDTENLPRNLAAQHGMAVTLKASQKAA